MIRILHRFPGAAQHHKRVHARLRRAMAKRSDALQTRDRRELKTGTRGDREGPGSAVHRYALHRIRGTRVRRVRDWPHASFHRDVRRGLFPLDWAGDMDAVGQYGPNEDGGLRFRLRAPRFGGLQPSEAWQSKRRRVA